jgi:fatty acid desaturase
MNVAIQFATPVDSEAREQSDEGRAETVPHSLISDLHTPRPAIFWADLITCALAGWGSFALAVRWQPLSGSMLAALTVSALALYRGLCFIHELTHLRRRALPGFEAAWNVLFGVPLLLPSFTYVGVHQSHHSLATYGTTDDPEYLPFAHSRRMLYAFTVQSSLVIPALLLLRFLLLAPIGLVSRRFHGWLEACASSFAMNPAYRRVVPAAVATSMRRWELAILAGWVVALTLMLTGVLPVRTLAVWYAMLVGVCILNTARVLGAHEYESDGAPRNRDGQLRDSIDTPGGPWTELWAPVGLRYHALHHYFPGIPYHNLGTAYRRIVAAPADPSAYLQSTSPSLRHSLSELHRKAITSRDGT